MTHKETRWIRWFIPKGKKPSPIVTWHVPGNEAKLYENRDNAYAAAKYEQLANGGTIKIMKNRFELKTKRNDIGTFVWVPINLRLELP